MVARARRGVWAPIVSNIRGAYVRIRFLNGVRPEKRAADRESCHFSLVVCYTATGKWPMHSFIAYLRANDARCQYQLRCLMAGLAVIDEYREHV